jgi:dipeptidyl aminopeptidase/acylaminoacyl peptidase
MNWCRTAATLCVAVLFSGLSAAAIAAPPTAEEYARASQMSSVSISPDGKRLASLVSADGKTMVISVWSIDDPSAKPKVFPTQPGVHIRSVQFVKNDFLLAGIEVELPKVIPPGRFRKAMLVPLDGSQAVNFDGVKLIDRMPDDPDRILVKVRGNSDLFAYNVRTRTSVNIANDVPRPKPSLLSGHVFFVSQDADLQQQWRGGQTYGFDKGDVYFAQWFRDPADNSWKEHFRWYARDREPVSVVGFTRDPNIALIRMTRGRDKAAIYEYDIHAAKVKTPAFEHPLFDAVGVVQSNTRGHAGEILGFAYDGPRQSMIYWADEDLEVASRTAKEALGEKTRVVEWTDVASGKRFKLPTPDGASVEISDWSDDFKRFVVVKSGPTTPPEFYLLADGKVRLLGRSKPWIDTAALGDTRLIQYPARDGLMIPAYLTAPPRSLHGPGPYPTVIVPHGGPWSRDDGGWDSSGWVQYFASHGYAVLQPQFRGSDGWGQRLWRAGDGEWGQKMQDDLDDGVRWMVAQGFAAPDRVAIHGFSYGGYAATVAAIRPNGLYQCAISGAGVFSLDFFRREITDDRVAREFQAPTVKGLDPMDHVEKVSIPMLVYHGDWDTVVPFKQSERLDRALTNAGKLHAFQRLETMEHTAGDTPALQAALLTTLENYLKKDCGPGGL